MGLQSQKIADPSIRTINPAGKKIVIAPKLESKTYPRNTTKIKIKIKIKIKNVYKHKYKYPKHKRFEYPSPSRS